VRKKDPGIGRSAGFAQPSFSQAFNLIHRLPDPERKKTADAQIDRGSDAQIHAVAIGRGIMRP